MSRETFVIKATLQSKVAAKGETAPIGDTVYLHIPHIVALLDTDKGCDVLTSTSIVYSVTQKAEYFLNKGKAYNVFKELNNV